MKRLLSGQVKAYGQPPTVSSLANVAIRMLPGHEKQKKNKVPSITLTSFICAGAPAMLRSELNEINTNIAATLVCNYKGEV